jgi:proline iminopeptidase
MRLDSSIDRRAVLAGGAMLLAGAATAGANVNAEHAIEAAGARLYMLVRGANPGAPILLWLHGGPGGAERPLFRLYNADLEKHFLVAYLDQRGAGRSFDRRADPGALTVARHLADLDVVIDRLRADYGREKVILLGHSWGSLLGLLYARRHGGKVAAVLGTGVGVSAAATQRAQYEFIQSEAERRRDADGLRKIAALGPPPFSAREELASQALVDRYGGYFHRQPNFTWAVARAVAGGLVGPLEIRRIIQGNNVSLEAMNAELARLDVTREVPALDVPLAFLLGRHDRQTDSRLAAAWFDRLSAPRKRLVWFEHSAHNVPFEEPDAFNAAIPRLVGELLATG